MNNILVLGGTGFVGRSVCEKLVERCGGAGGRIRVPTRRIGRTARHLQLLPTRRGGVGRRARRRDAGAPGGRQRRGDQPGRHPARQRSRRSSASTWRCRARLARGLPGRPACGAWSTSARSASAADAPSRYLRSQGRAARRCCAAAGLDLTMLRPSVIFGADDRFLNLFASAAGVLPGDAAGRRRRALPAGVGGGRGQRHRRAASTTPTTASARPIECAGPRVYTLARAGARWPAAGRATSGR